MLCSRRRRRPPTIWCWRGHCSPSARRRYCRGTGAALSGAAAFARGHSRSRPERRPFPRGSRPGKKAIGRSAATIAIPHRGRSPERHRHVILWRRAACGFAPPSDGRKNAEARWLLPMICRRGGIDKHDIGAIRIMDATTEFEISERVAESFAAKIQRPGQGRQYPDRATGRCATAGPCASGKAVAPAAARGQGRRPQCSSQRQISRRESAETAR